MTLVTLAMQAPMVVVDLDPMVLVLTGVEEEMVGSNVIRVINDILEFDLIEKISNKYLNARYKYYWKSNTNADLHHWHIPILSNDSGDNRNDISNNLMLPNYNLECEAWKQIQNTIGSSDLLRYYVNGYTFGTEGAPHKDSSHAEDVTTVIYLNNKWSPLWAGETVVFNEKNNDIEVACLPKLGRAIIFPSNRLHAARAVSKTCPELRLVLVCKSKPKNEDERLSALSAQLINRFKVNSIPHSKGTFIDHLVGTYQILKKQELPQYLCDAGLFHSIYGTNIFKIGVADDRSVIRQLIGEKAEKLVWTFCQLQRPDCWNTDFSTVLMTKNHNIIEVTPEEFNDLKLIESANIQEQAPRTTVRT